MNFQSFIFFLDNHPSGEATQKFSEFLELWLILYKNNKFGHYSLNSGNSKIDLIFSRASWVTTAGPACQHSVTALTAANSGFDRRFLAAGDLAGDKVDSYVILVT